jgi:hypothetical protein
MDHVPAPILAPGGPTATIGARVANRFLLHRPASRIGPWRHTLWPYRVSLESLGSSCGCFRLELFQALGACPSSQMSTRIWKKMESPACLWCKDVVQSCPGRRAARSGSSRVLVRADPGPPRKQARKEPFTFCRDPGSAVHRAAHLQRSAIRSGRAVLHPGTASLLRAELHAGTRRSMTAGISAG